MIDRKRFFDTVRTSLFNGKLAGSQVAGMNAILDEWESGGWIGASDLNKLSYMFSTAYHETAYTMQPIIERGGPAYFDKYEPGTKIGKMLGNTQKGDGLLFKGRGYVQLTGRANYVKASQKLGVDLVNFPDQSCEMKNAIKIMFFGMFEGWFTGKKLDSYITAAKADFVNSRRIINGTDRSQDIAGYAKKFRTAL